MHILLTTALLKELRLENSFSIHLFVRRTICYGLLGCALSCGIYMLEGITVFRGSEKDLVVFGPLFLKWKQTSLLTINK